MVMQWTDKDHAGNEICRYCGDTHHIESCPRITSIEYHTDGRIKKVEFKGGMDVGSMVPEESETSGPGGGDFRFGGGTGPDQDGGVAPTSG